MVKKFKDEISKHIQDIKTDFEREKKNGKDSENILNQDIQGIKSDLEKDRKNRKDIENKLSNDISSSKTELKDIVKLFFDKLKSSELALLDNQISEIQSKINDNDSSIQKQNMGFKQLYEKVLNLESQTNSINMKNCNLMNFF